jgi:hypothetical protein
LVPFGYCNIGKSVFHVSTHSGSRIVTCEQPKNRRDKPHENQETHLWPRVLFVSGPPQTLAILRVLVRLGTPQTKPIFGSVPRWYLVHFRSVSPTHPLTAYHSAVSLTLYTFYSARLIHVAHAFLYWHRGPQMHLLQLCVVGLCNRQIDHGTHWFTSTQGSLFPLSQLPIAATMTDLCRIISFW